MASSSGSERDEKRLKRRRAKLKGDFEVFRNKRLAETERRRRRWIVVGGATLIAFVGVVTAGLVFFQGGGNPAANPAKDAAQPVAGGDAKPAEQALASPGGGSTSEFENYLDRMPPLPPLVRPEPASSARWRLNHPPLSHLVTWQGKADPPAVKVSSAAAPDKPRQLPVPSGELVFAPGTPFMLAHEESKAPVLVNLSAGKQIGRFAVAAPVNRSTRLSSDGQLLATLTANGPRNTIEIWKLGEKAATAQIECPSAVAWFELSMDGRSLVAHCRNDEGQRVIGWEIPGGKQTLDLALPEQFFGGGWPPSGRPGCEPGALSPGGKYVALLAQPGTIRATQTTSTPRRFGRRSPPPSPPPPKPQRPTVPPAPGHRIIVISLADRKPVGDLFAQYEDHLNGWTLRNLRFSPDGSELWAVHLLIINQYRGEPAQRSHLACWSMQDGKTTVDTRLSADLVDGPILPGPDPDSLVLSGNYEWAFRADFMTRCLPEAPGLVVDRGTGATLYMLRFSPTARLADGSYAGAEPMPLARALLRGGYAMDPRVPRRTVSRALDQSVYAKSAQGARQALGQRPESKPGDRTGLAHKEPSAPAKWSVPPSAPVAGELLASIKVPGTAIDDGAPGCEPATQLPEAQAKAPEASAETPAAKPSARGGKANTPSSVASARETAALLKAAHQARQAVAAQNPGAAPAATFVNPSSVGDPVPMIAPERAVIAKKVRDDLEKQLKQDVRAKGSSTWMQLQLNGIPDAPPVDPAVQHVVFAGSRAALLTISAQRQPKPRVVTVVNDVDLKTGKIGQRRFLFSRANTLTHDGLGSLTFPQDATSAPQTALSLDGKLAVRDVSDLKRVDAWDASGRALASFEPYDSGAVQWLGWSADGKLLTVGNRLFTAWDAASGKALFEIAGDYTGAAVLSRGHDWVALAASGRIDILDTATGECRGRLEGLRQTLELSISPDGAQLAAFAPAPRGAGQGWRQVRAWKLSDGSAAGMATLIPEGYLPTLWAGPRQLLVTGATLVDLDAGCALSKWTPEPGRPLAEPPDGRFWFLAMGSTTGNDGTLSAAAPPQATAKLVFGPRVPLRVEANCGDSARDAEVVQYLTRIAQEMGQTMGDGGWTLRVKGKEQDGGQKMTFGLGLELPLPSVDGGVQLVAPDGKIVVDTFAQIGFPKTGSKYYAKKQDVTYGPNAKWIEYYDFHGRDPKAAMADETWNHFKIHNRFYPVGIARVAGNYVVAPMKETALSH